MSSERARGNEKETIHQFTVSRYATVFDPLEVVASATRQAQDEQVVGMLMDPADKDALNFCYEADHCGAEVYVDLTV